MQSLIVYTLPYILGIVLLVALVSSVSNFRRAHSAPYFRIRRDATQAAWRWLLALVVCVGGLYATLSARRTLPPPDLDSLWPSSPTMTPTFALLGMPTPTLDPNATPKEPFAGPPTITPTQPTATPTPTPFITSLQSDVTPPADAAVKITAIASGITTERAPVSAGTKFPVGTPRIYVFFDFSNMADGVSWSRALLRDGSVIFSESEAWSRGEQGKTYDWFNAQGGGLSAGNYQVQFYIGEKMIAQGVFTIE
jgi:hypothetical protein